MNSPWMSDCGRDKSRLLLLCGAIFGAVLFGVAELGCYSERARPVPPSQNRARTRKAPPEWPPAAAAPAIGAFKRALALLKSGAARRKRARLTSVLGRAFDVERDCAGAVATDLLPAYRMAMNGPRLKGLLPVAILLVKEHREEVYVEPDERSSFALCGLSVVRTSKPDGYTLRVTLLYELPDGPPRRITARWRPHPLGAPLLMLHVDTAPTIRNDPLSSSKELILREYRSGLLADLGIFLLRRELLPGTFVGRVHLRSQPKPAPRLIIHTGEAKVRAIQLRSRRTVILRTRCLNVWRIAGTFAEPKLLPVYGPALKRLLKIKGMAPFRRFHVPQDNKRCQRWM